MIKYKTQCEQKQRFHLIKEQLFGIWRYREFELTDISISILPREFKFTTHQPYKNNIILKL